MDCMRCGAPSGNKALCPQCLSAGRQPSAPVYEPGVSSAGYLREVLLTYPLQILGGTFVIGWLLWIGPFKYLHPTILSPLKLPTNYNSSANAVTPCSNKDRCLVIFMTPWCPACHGSVGFVRDLRTHLERQSKIRFSIVLGGDSPEALNEFANQIGGEIYIDARAEFQRAARFSAVPQWIYFDRNGAVLRQFSGGGFSGGSAEQNIQWFVNEKFSGEERYFY